MTNHLSPLERLKLVINSNSPLVIMETVEEPRAVNLARIAASDLQLPIFEWSIADGLIRYEKPKPVAPPPPSHTSALIMQALTGQDPQPLPLTTGAPILNTQDPSGMLAHILTMNIEAVFVFKD